MRKIILTAALLAFALPAQAQVDNLLLGALITNAAQVPGTVNGPTQRNDKSKGIVCTFNQASEVGNPSTVISVQFDDTASNTWQTLVSSTAVSQATGVSASVMVYPGAVATAVPTLMGVSGLRLPTIWRVVEVVTGGTSTTGTVGCDLLN